VVMESGSARSYEALETNRALRIPLPRCWYIPNKRIATTVVMAWRLTFFHRSGVGQLHSVGQNLRIW
jgi:hypothetical protein